MKLKKVLPFYLPALVLTFLFFVNSADATTLQVPIPGDSDDSVTDIGEYIQLVYNYAISIVGIVATIMLMFGGFTWLTAGGSGEKVGKARDIIFGALTGLVLALTSYTILNLVNPDLVKFKVPSLEEPRTGSNYTNDFANSSSCQRDVECLTGFFCINNKCAERVDNYVVGGNNNCKAYQMACQNTSECCPNLSCKPFQVGATALSCN